MCVYVCVCVVRMNESSKSLGRDKPDHIRHCAALNNRLSRGVPALEREQEGSQSDR